MANESDDEFPDLIEEMDVDDYIQLLENYIQLLENTITALESKREDFRDLIEGATASECWGDCCEVSYESIMIEFKRIFGDKKKEV